MSHQLTPEQQQLFNRQKGKGNMAYGVFILLLAGAYYFASSYYTAHPPHRVKAIYYLFNGFLGTIGGTLLLAAIGLALIGIGYNQFKK